MMLFMVVATVVICTRNRPRDLAVCLRSIQTSVTESRHLLVVDSSPDDRSELVVDSARPRMAGNVVYVKSAPGLTFQRNVALDLIGSSHRIVHFIDDDVEVESAYFSEIEGFLQSHRAYVGCGGFITNLPPEPSIARFSPFARSTTQGSVSRSGVNYLVRKIGVDEFRNVDWLSGCSMSFNLDRISGLRFDERRKGVGTGEDVDFCLRALQRGPIAVTGRARMVHHQSLSNRADQESTDRAIVAHRLQLADDGLHGISRSRVYSRLFLHASLASARAALNRSSSDWASAKTIFKSLASSRK